MELGVPGMEGLANEFLVHSRRWGIEPDLVQKLMGNDLDVEHFIEELDRIYGVGPSLKSIGQDTAVLQGAEKVRAEVEWFVQHAAERVAAEDAQLMWGSVLRSTMVEQVEITFVTTNYDRAIELAANREEVLLDDGFAPFTEGETVQWTGFGLNEKRPMIVKLHGSTDWFADKATGRPTKLRHPMPLFGRSVLKIEGQELDSGLVLPSREKMLTKSPYQRLSQSFLNATDSCDLAVFVGSSLRDNLIQEAVRSIAMRAALFIVNPDCNDHNVEGAAVISQHASTFLLSTFPNALFTANPVDALREARRTSTAKSRGILPAVRDLLDTSVDAGQRCHAIEELDETGVTLAPRLIQQILDDDNPTVARYGLGLIPLSTSQEQLIKVAANGRHKGDPAFCEELELLRKLQVGNLSLVSR